MNAPAFELKMQEPPRTGERLNDLTDLVGETILAAFDNNDDGAFVLVTETRNWIVLEAKDDGLSDAAPFIRIKREPHHRADQQVLSDFVRPRELLDAGVINAGVHAELQARADAVEQAEKERKAAHLRAELAKLEGTAAPTPTPPVTGRAAGGFALLDTFFFTAISTCLIAAALCWFGPSVLDEGRTYESYGYAPVDTEALTAEASRIADIAACQALHGPHAYAVHFPDGQHRCTDKRGRRLSPSSVITVMHEATR